MTAHAIQRVSDRMGLPRSSASRIITNAFLRGVDADSLHSRERRYMKCQEEKQGCKLKLYNGYCFIFNDEGICITLYLAPKWFGKKSQYHAKEYIRDPKKYLSHYANTDSDDYSPPDQDY